MCDSDVGYAGIDSRFRSANAEPNRCPMGCGAGRAALRQRHDECSTNARRDREREGRFGGCRWGADRQVGERENRQAAWRALPVCFLYPSSSRVELDGCHRCRSNRSNRSCRSCRSFQRISDRSARSTGSAFRRAFHLSTRGLSSWHSWTAVLDADPTDQADPTDHRTQRSLN